MVDHIFHNIKEQLIQEEECGETHASFIFLKWGCHLKQLQEGNDAETQGFNGIKGAAWWHLSVQTHWAENREATLSFWFQKCRSFTERFQRSSWEDICLTLKQQGGRDESFKVYNTFISAFLCLFLCVENEKTAPYMVINRNCVRIPLGPIVIRTF